MGRLKKEKISVTIANTEAQVIEDRLGYKRIQDLLDDLTMGINPPTAVPTAPPPELPTVEGSGRSLEVAQPGLSLNPESSNKKSWAIEAEEAEVAEKSVVEHLSLLMLNQGRANQRLLVTLQSI